MRRRAPLLLLLLSAAACDRRSTPSVLAPTSSPTVPAPSPPNPRELVAVYVSTFTASASCASALPETAQERTYTATLFSDGAIQWTGPTLNPSPGHYPVSSGSLSGDVFSFSIDFDRDPQSDDFHGISDDIGGGTFLNISGKGTGAVREGEITGAFNGLLALYEPVPDPNVLWIGHYCRAADHRFKFVKH
jgi:hypothetical protein